MHTRPQNFQRLLLIFPLVIFLVSLFMPAFNFEEQASLSGFHVLLWGWWGVVTLNIAWFANVFFVVSVICFLLGRKKASFLFSLCTLVLSLNTLTASKWWFDEGSSTVIASFGSAVYLWWLSFFLLFLVNLLARVFDN